VLFFKLHFLTHTGHAQGEHLLGLELEGFSISVKPWGTDSSLQNTSLKDLKFTLKNSRHTRMNK